MIPLQSIIFEIKAPHDVVRNLRDHIRKKSRHAVIFNFYWPYNNKILGYIKADNTSFILVPRAGKVLLQRRLTNVLIKGKIVNNNVIKVKLLLSFTGFLTFATFLFFTLLFIFLPIGESYQGKILLFFSAVAMIEIVQFYRDIISAEQQIEALLQKVDSR